MLETYSLMFKTEYYKNYKPHTDCPVDSAISCRFENTNGTVSGFGLNSVFWLFLELCHTECELEKVATTQGIPLPPNPDHLPS